ncbi:hypothetical protein F4804DRAFT_335378 [Jackrogersella minutella]|nr:hypothetical protein F4804DRAFT_335378 [Jackrogersella minutella]
MTTDYWNSEVMDFPSSFGSAVLGTLEYNNDEQDWLLAFGHEVARYEYLMTYQNRDLQDQARLDDFIRDIENMSEQHMINSKVKDDKNFKECITQIRRFVKAIHRENSYALFLIAGCSWYLGKSYWLTSKLDSGHRSQMKDTANTYLREPKTIESDSGHKMQLEYTANTYLRELKISCPSITIQEEVLLAKLKQKLCRCQQDISIQDIREVLQELCKPLQVLLVSADPKDASPTRPGTERRSLSEALCEAKFSHRFKITDIPGCRIKDIPRALNRYKPDILQFLGHGDETGLYFEGQDDTAKLVQMKYFADLLGHYKGTIKLVILNTCFSSQGQCIAEAIGCFIGMEGQIRNKDAITFTNNFYGALGDGLSIRKSFDLAGATAKLDSEARFQAHLLQKGQTPTAFYTQPLPAYNYRGLSMHTTKRPVVLAILLCVLASAGYFQNVHGPVRTAINLWPVIWNVPIISLREKKGYEMWQCFVAKCG